MEVEEDLHSGWPPCVAGGDPCSPGDRRQHAANHRGCWKAGAAWPILSAGWRSSARPPRGGDWRRWSWGGRRAGAPQAGLRGRRAARPRRGWPARWPPPATRAVFH